MLTAYNICKKYNGNKEESIKNFTYQFEDTGFYLVVGPSGAGKSTLLGILSGIDNHYEGYFAYDDQKIENRNRAFYRNEISSIVFQNINLIESLSIKENLRIGFDLAKEKFDIEKCKNLLKKVHLPDGKENVEDFLKKRPNQLSLGQKQRLAIARSIIKKRKILFLDEPTSSLDKENASRIAMILEELSKKMLVIVVTHSLDDFSLIEKPKAILAIKDGQLSSPSIITTKNLKKRRRISGVNLSLVSSFSLAKTNLFASKIKLILCLVMTILSLSCLASFYTIKTVDENDVYLKAQDEIDQNLAFFSLTLVNKDVKNDDEVEKPIVLLDEQEKILSEMDAHDVFKSDILTRIEYKYESQTHEIPALWFCFHGEYSNYFMEMWNEEDPNFKKDPRLENNKNAHFPQTYEDIAISSFYADTLAKYGSEINGFKSDDVNDLIGKRISGYTITNIYTTKDSEILSQINDESINLDERAKLAQETSYAQMIYVKPGFHQQYVPSDSDDDSNFESEETNILYYAFEYKNRNEALKKLRSLEIESGTKRYSANIISLFSGREVLTIIIDTEMADLFLYVIFFFLFLSVVSLLLLFISNIEKERYSYGVLLSMGSSSKSLFITLLMKAIMLLSIVFTLTLVTVSIAFMIYNSIVSLPLLGVHFKMILLLVGILLSIGLFLAIIGTIKSSKTNISKLLKN